MNKLIELCNQDGIESLQNSLSEFLSSNEKKSNFGNGQQQLFLAIVNKLTSLIQSQDHLEIQLLLVQTLRLLTRSQELASNLHAIDFQKIHDFISIALNKETKITDVLIVEILAICKRLLYFNNKLSAFYTPKTISQVLDLIDRQQQNLLVSLLDFLKLMLEIDSPIVVQEIQQLYYIGKLMVLLEKKWVDVKIMTANLLTKLLDFQQIHDNFKKLAGLASVLQELQLNNKQIELKIPLLNLLLKLSSDSSNYQDFKIHDVIQLLNEDLNDSTNYLIITTVINILGSLALDEEQSSKIMQISLQQIINLLFKCHPHNQSELKFKDIQKSDYNVATKELQLYIFRLLRYLGSMSKYRTIFKQIFIPRLLQIFIDIGNYTQALNGYKKIVEEFNKIPPEDLLCMQDSLNQLILHQPVEKKINDYEILEQIGKGAFGSVYLCRLGQNLYALKQINGVDTLEYREVQIHKNLVHPNIIKLYECFIYEKSLCIVMEYLEGFNLSELIKMKSEKGQLFEEDQIWKIIIDISSVLRYLHIDQQILHRDLNPANIMVDSNYQIKICDFGLAKQFQEDVVNNSFVGTLIYTCPQIVENKNYSEKADIWALGCILYELIQLKPAFSSQNPLMLANKIVQLEYEELNQTYYSDELSRLIKLCLCKNESERPNILELLELISHKTIIFMDQLKNDQEQLIKQKNNSRSHQQSIDTVSTQDWLVFQKLIQISNSKKSDEFIAIEVFQRRLLSNSQVFVANEIKKLSNLSNELIPYLNGITYEQLYFQIIKATKIQ